MINNISNSIYANYKANRPAFQAKNKHKPQDIFGEAVSHCNSGNPLLGVGVKYSRPPVVHVELKGTKPMSADITPKGLKNCQGGSEDDIIAEIAKRKNTYRNSHHR